MGTGQNPVYLNPKIFSQKSKILLFSESGVFSWGGIIGMKSCLLGNRVKCHSPSFHGNLGLAFFRNP